MLFTKLSNYGIDWNFVSWISLFLNNWTQAIKIQEVCFLAKLINSDPLLFAVFVKERFENGHRG